MDGVIYVQHGFGHRFLNRGEGAVMCQWKIKEETFVQVRAQDDQSMNY